MKLQQADRHSIKLFEPGRKDRTDESLIPLINIVFLILIFFMIAGRMEAPDPIRVDPPVSSSPTRPAPPQLTLVLAADGRIAAEGEILESQRLGEWLAQGRLRSSADIEAGDQTPEITLKADMGVRARQLRSVLNTLRRAGVRKITLLTVLRP